MEDVQKSEDVQYLCLDPAVQLSVGETVYAIGWGSINVDGNGDLESSVFTILGFERVINFIFSDQVSSDVLKQVSFEILGHDECSPIIDFNETKQFCAGEPTRINTTIKDTCELASLKPTLFSR